MFGILRGGAIPRAHDQAGGPGFLERLAIRTARVHPHVFRSFLVNVLRLLELLIGALDHDDQAALQQLVSVILREPVERTVLSELVLEKPGTPHNLLMLTNQFQQDLLPGRSQRAKGSQASIILPPDARGPRWPLDFYHRPRPQMHCEPLRCLPSEPTRSEQTKSSCFLHRRVTAAMAASCCQLW